MSPALALLAAYWKPLIAAVAAFFIGYQTCDYFANKTIVRLQAERLALSAAAESERQRLTLRAKSSQEIADAAAKALEEFTSKPLPVTERVIRVSVPGGVCKPTDSGRAAKEGEGKPITAGNADSAPAIPDGRYIRHRDYEVIRDALLSKLDEYKKQHRAHIGLSEIVQSLEGIEIVE